MKGEAAEWVVQGSDGRKLQFHNFDDTRINPFDQMLDFLTDHGHCLTTTYAISHNGTPNHAIRKVQLSAEVGFGLFRNGPGIS